MKYVILNDLYNIFVNKFKIFFSFILLLSLYPIYLKYIIDIIIEKKQIDFMLLQNIGGNYKTMFLVDIFLILCVFSYFIFIALYTYLNNVRYGKENIFLRINIKKWIIIKILSIFIYTLVIELILFITLNLVYYIIGISLEINSFINIIITDYFLKVCLQLIVISLILYFRIYFIPLLLFLLLLPIVFNNFIFLTYFYTLTFLNSKILLIIFTLLILCFTIIINRRRIFVIFEEEL